MKKTALILVVALSVAGCTSDNNPNASKDSLNTAADTINSVTNPGVGSVADDTARKN